MKYTIKLIFLIAFILPINEASKIKAQAWIQKGIDIDGNGSYAGIGHSISLSKDSNIVAFGTRSGHVKVYSWNGTTWIQKGANINGEVFNDWAGFSVDINSAGNTVAIGAIYNDGNGSNAGHTRVYIWNGSAWIQKGTDIDGEWNLDESGTSVSLSSDGNTVAIGAQFNDGNGQGSGHVRIYMWNGSAWIQKGIDVDGEYSNSHSGRSVSLSADGNTFAVGAPENYGNALNAGHGRVYFWDGTAWVQKGLDIDGNAVDDRAGMSISLSSHGNTVAIGALQNGNANGLGYVMIYSWNGTTWIQKALNILGETIGDAGGWSLSINSDGNKVAIGTPWNDENAIDAGHVRIFEYGTCPSDSGIQVITTCDSLIWIDNQVYYTSNNSAMWTLQNSNGCDSVFTLNLTIIGSTIFTNTNIEICQGDSIFCGGEWISTSGTCNDTLISFTGCDSIIINTITVNSLPNVSLTSFNPDTICVNANAVNLPTGSPSGGDYFGNGIIGSNFNPSTAGVGVHNIIYTYTDINSCTNSDTTSITVVNCVDIDENITNYGIMIYPNPNTGLFTVEKPNGLNKLVQVKLFDASSKLILEKIIPINNRKIEIDIRNHNNGIYYLHLNVDNEKIVKKISKN